MAEQTEQTYPGWQKLSPGTVVKLTDSEISAMRANLRRLALNGGLASVMTDEQIEAQIAKAQRADIFLNDTYVVSVHAERAGEPGADGLFPALAHLSIRRQDRGDEFPWRDLQCIKNDLLGFEAECIEIFPAESRLVDTANQRHLWCFGNMDLTKLPAAFVSDRLPCGFNTRLVDLNPSTCDPEGGVLWQQSGAKPKPETHRGYDIVHVCPPIPTRVYDWGAVDPNSDGEYVAFGATKERCIDELDTYLAGLDDGGHF